MRDPNLLTKEERELFKVYFKFACQQRWRQPVHNCITEDVYFNQGIEDDLYFIEIGPDYKDEVLNRSWCDKSYYIYRNDDDLIDWHSREFMIEKILLYNKKPSNTYKFKKLFLPLHKLTRKFQ